MLRRVPDWPARLTAAIGDRRRARGAWGVNDCALFTCDCVRAMTGVDMAAEFRGTYRCAFGAARRLRDVGGGDLERLVEVTARRLEIPEIPPAFASAGDVGLTDRAPDGGPALGICVGPFFVFGGIEAGLHRLARADIRRAWRI